MTVQLKNAIRNRLYYLAKPFIPRSIQIGVRRAWARRLRPHVSSVWPIDENIENRPADWPGWPHGKAFAFVPNHDVESQAGHDKVVQLMDLEENLEYRSTFHFVPQRYVVSAGLRAEVTRRGFDVGVHGLKHDGKLFWSRKIFDTRVPAINLYLQAWQTSGFSSPSMHHRLDWMHALNIDYSQSTFDSDPFEPQPDGIRRIFPFLVRNGDDHTFAELPYTLPQDFTLFIILQERDILIWKRKLDWIARRGGMALVTTHPDYMHFSAKADGPTQYPSRLYADLLEHVTREYGSSCWHTTSAKVAAHLLRSAEVQP